MANILKVTTPQIGYDNTNTNVKNNPTTQKKIGIQTGENIEGLLSKENLNEILNAEEKKYFAESNFGSFLEAMKKTPKEGEIVSKLLFQDFDKMVNVGMNLGFSEEISKFLDSIKQSPESLNQFIKEQLKSTTRFQGEFFEKIRTIMNQTDSVELRATILDFMKRYVDMTCGYHLLKQMSYHLTEIQKYMFRADKERLQLLKQQLNQEAPLGDTKGNEQILKRAILPFLGAYIKKTHDFGAIREQISLLMIQVARYENGNKDELLKVFQVLKRYRGFYQVFGDLDEATLFSLLCEKEEEPLGQMQAQFFSILSEGVKGAGGMENRHIFESLMHSFLLNESVYMPLIHVMVPIEMFGRKMVSELWLAPDELGNGVQAKERQIKVLLKFSIEDLGDVHAILLYRNNSICAELLCPKQLQEEDKKIKDEVLSILERNNFSIQSFHVAYGEKEQDIIKVFQKLYERKKGIHVRV